MQVNLFSTFREHAGINNFDLDIAPKTTVTEAIGKIGDPDSIGTLHNLITNGNDLQRQGAIEALGNLRSETSADILQRVLSKDTHQGVRLLAAVALGNIGAKSAVESLAARATDREEDSSVRAYAIESLGKLKATAKISVILAVFEESHKQSPGGMLPGHCHSALASIIDEDISSYGVSHPAPGQLDKCVQAWRQWWENTGRLKYPQN